MRDEERGKRLVAVFLLGVVLLSSPLVAVMETGRGLFGLPLLVLYVFAAWGGIIALLALIVERKPPR
jgi:hypothetical protein